MVVNASRGNRFERLDHRAQSELLLRPKVIPEEEVQVSGEGEFRGSAKAPELRVKCRNYRGIGRIEKAGGELPLLVLRVALLECLGQPTRVVLHLASPLLPELRDEVQQLGETREAIPRLGGEVGSPVKRSEVRSQEYVERPASPPGPPGTRSACRRRAGGCSSAPTAPSRKAKRPAGSAATSSPGPHPARPAARRWRRGGSRRWQEE